MTPPTAMKVASSVASALIGGVFLGTAPLLGVAAYWPEYVREWLIWNQVRCIASLAAVVIAMLALAR